MRSFLAGVAFVASVVLFASALVLATAAAAKRDGVANPFTTDASRTASIHFVPLDARARSLVESTVPTVKRWLSSRYPTEITEAATPKPNWIIEDRRQLNALVVLSDLHARWVHARGKQASFLILVTSGSMYDPSEPSYQFEFGSRPIREDSHQVMNMIATAQMRRFHPDREKARLTKMILRYVGERACLLAYNDDPASVMNRHILSDADLDRMV